MANILESSQTQASTAPGYYTDYLSNIASGAKAAIDPTTGAQFVGADPLQNKAFSTVEQKAGDYTGTLGNAETTLGNATSTTSPLSAASNYLNTAEGDVGQSASNLMNPYTQNVVNSIADAGQRNIMQNLAPQATAGAVGAGQFGSTRGAQVLGQTIANANKDIQNQQYQALKSGYDTALQTAMQQKQLEGTLANTAGNLASSGQTNLTNAGIAQGNLAKTNQELGLKDVNALSTVGAARQTIAQNKELFPLTNLTTASALLRGYNVPTTTKTTAEMSPLSAMAGVGAGAIGLFTKDANGNTPYDNIKAAYNNIKTPTVNADGTTNPATEAEKDDALAAAGYVQDPGGSGYLIKNGNYYAVDGNNNPVLVGPITTDTNIGDQGSGGEWVTDPETGEVTFVAYARGGSVGQYANGGSAGSWNTSFVPHMQIGGLPAGGMPQYDQSNTYIGYNDTDGNFVRQ